jgi:hypothetical protein
MPDNGLPRIPLALRNLPTVGGVVVPWISLRTPDGRYLLGVIDQSRADLALLRRLCGVCGRPLETRLVLMMRLSDLPRQRTNEPALHPWCAAYTRTACPMIAGRQSHYRKSPPRVDDSMAHVPDASARQGARAEPWFAVWLTTYEVVTDHGNLAASYAGVGPLRIRPLTWNELELK